MKRLSFYSLWSILIFSACAPRKPILTHSTFLEVEKKDDDTLLKSIIFPYQSELEKEMAAHIAYAPEALVKGRPNANLNNWSADALLSFGRRHFSDSIPLVVLLNTGGLRSTINQGEVTLGDLYKLMPFDNEVVLVTLPLSSLNDIEVYLKKSGGEPIAGMDMSGGTLRLDQETRSGQFRVLTSDYLMNGGDKMYFFEQKTDWKYANKLLRDVFIEEARRQDSLYVNSEIRISF